MLKLKILIHAEFSDNVHVAIRFVGRLEHLIHYYLHFVSVLKIKYYLLYKFTTISCCITDEMYINGFFNIFLFFLYSFPIAPESLQCPPGSGTTQYGKHCIEYKSFKPLIFSCLINTSVMTLLSENNGRTNEQNAFNIIYTTRIMTFERMVLTKDCIVTVKSYMYLKVETRSQPFFE